MSENIQSISQGTYTIGNTNELTFSAGPGIKIDQPSEGTVRIGNDETVLWSGNGSTGPFNLSESWLNFELIKVVAYYSNKTMLFEYTIPTDSGVNTVSIGGTFYVSNDVAPLQMVSCTYTLSNDKQTLTKANGRRMWHPGNDGASYNGFNFLKIIGINRISGSNA